MTTILAIECSTEVASVALHFTKALGANAQVGDDRSSLNLSDKTSGVSTHSQTILPMVQGLLSKAGMALSDCDAIAFGAGPGSFTGVRSACGVAQGLAYGADLPVIAVDTLAAVALQCDMQERCPPDQASQGSQTRDVVVVMDARMGEVYWAQYRFLPKLSSQDMSDLSWTVVIKPTLSTPELVAPTGRYIACGNAFEIHPALLAGAENCEATVSNVMPHAEHVALLAQTLFSNGETTAAHAARPVYLRNEVALTTAQRLAKKMDTAA